MPQELIENEEEQDLSDWIYVLKVDCNDPSVVLHHAKITSKAEEGSL